MSNIFGLKNITADKVIIPAFKMIGLYSEGMGLSGEETASAIDKLNVILSSYQNNYPLINKKMEVIKKISTKSSVIGNDGYVYSCIKSHKAINTYPTDSVYNDGDLCYSLTADNGIIYQVTTSAPSTLTLASEWTLDKNEYYSDGTYYFQPYSSSDGYGIDARPGVDDNLSNLYFKKTDTSYDIPSIGFIYSSGTYLAVKPTDRNFYMLIKVTTGFNYTVAKSYADWLVVGTLQTSALHYSSGTQFNSTDSVKIPDNVSNINDVFSVDIENNTNECMSEITMDDYMNIYNPDDTGTRPQYYTKYFINNERYLLLHPLLNPDSNYSALRINAITKINNVGSIDSEIEIIDEMISLIIHELAQELAILYGVDMNVLSVITAKLSELRKEFKGKFKYSESGFDYIGGY